MRGLRVAEIQELDPQRIRQAREWAGVSGRGLAKVIDKYPEWISKLERGKAGVVAPSLIEEIAGYLAGRGRLAGFTKDKLLDYFYGDIDLDFSIHVVPRMEVIEGQKTRAKVGRAVPLGQPSYQQQVARPAA